MSENDWVLKATQISKRYRIGARRNHQMTRARVVREALFSPYYRFKNLRSLSRFRDEDDDSVLWALRDISFVIKQGEVLGIMGPNGAGKSTLLKILSRIVSPTTGSFSYRGVLASLLEVGTGFNGELTGRENVYLNGSILGLKKRDIDKVFDEVVSFSGVERFIDTPVKKYSSGMTVRLAFSVAVHLNADIVILDEVLSVGDAQFSEKSMAKMKGIAKDGKTVIFVSHSTTAVSMLCSRALFLNAGRISDQGSVEKIAGLYLGNTVHARPTVSWSANSAPEADGLVRLVSARVINADLKAFEEIDIREKIAIEITFEVLKTERQIQAEFQITNDKSDVIFTAVEYHPDWSHQARPKGLYTVKGWIPGNFLSEGRFGVNICIGAKSPRNEYLQERGVLYFYVRDQILGESVRCDFGADVPGIVRPRILWT